MTAPIGKAGASPPNTNPDAGQIGLVAAVSIGIGGMVGAGIFSILGVVAQAAGNAMWLAFMIGGVVALLSTYSYAKLGAVFPSAGGAVHFLVKGFGDGVLAGGLNLFMWAGYIISLALYATAFGSYAATFFTTAPSPLLLKSLAVGSVLALTLVNAFGASIMGRGETLIVAVKVAILVLFAAAGLFFINPGNLSPALTAGGRSRSCSARACCSSAMRASGSSPMRPATCATRKVMLPRALYTAVILVIVLYLVVAVTVTGNLSNAQIEQAKDYALAEAAKPFLGEFGFRLIAIAALFSTASAINATLFGSANVCYMIARDGELPARLSRTEWKQATGGLLLTAALVILVTLAVRSFRHRHDGQRRVPAGLRRGERRPSARAEADRRQRDHRLAVAHHLSRDVRDPRGLHLSAATGGDRGAGPHRRSVVCRGMALSPLDWTDDQDTDAGRRGPEAGLSACCRTCRNTSAIPSASRVCGRRAGVTSATVLFRVGRTIGRATIPAPDIPARTTL